MRFSLAFVFLAAWAAVACAAEPQPIVLHGDNPHYFLFRGKPVVLIGSTEHYGAVLNLDLDAALYLNELQKSGLNLTRTFSGVYCEDSKSFGIRDNTLAPKAGRLICPYARSTKSGYAGGGNKFDLAKWDEGYFRRLKGFVAEAGKRGVVVEFVLFCPFYEDSMWNLSPMKAENNVNGIGAVPRTDVYTLKHADLVALHEALAKKIAVELQDCDNVYFEICNEPYFGGVTLDWQARIAVALDSAEAGRKHKHLIAQNIANGAQTIDKPNPLVSIFNFHYATPPDAVTMNFGLGKAIADDETGFKGSGDFIYRAEGWDFLMAGGAIYDNLDYSFTADKEDGTAEVSAPGGGGRSLRAQLHILRQFVEGFAFLRMTPDNSVLRGALPKGVTARALVETGRQYAVYVRGDKAAELSIELPKGDYSAAWIDTKDGKTAKAEDFAHAGGVKVLKVPEYSEDIALRILAK